MKNRIRFSHFRNEKGYSLIEVLAGLAIFTIILLGCFDSFLKAEGAVKTQDQIFARQRLFQNLIHIMGNPASLRAADISLGTTNILHKCLHGMMCIPSGGSLPLQDVSLYLPPMFFDGSKIQLSGAISGPPSAPVQYSPDGEPCIATTATSCLPDSYPIAVSTQYEVVCPPRYDLMVEYNTTWTGPNTTADITPSPYCMVAQYIKIHYNFYLMPGADPAKYNFAPLSGVVWVSAVMVARSQ